jgi:hypothetical protein
MNPTPLLLPRRGSTLTIAALCVAVLGAAIAAAPADVEARQRQTSVTGANGKTATRNVTRAGGDVQSSTTGPNGKTASRSVDRSATGTTVTVTGPNGKTSTRTTTVTP